MKYKCNYGEKILRGGGRGRRDCTLRAIEDIKLKKAASQ